MGAIQNSINGAIASVGVASRMISGNISESNDGNKSKQMADKARKNKDAVIAAKLAQRQIMKKREKEVKAVLTGANKDPKARVNVLQEMRER